MSLGRPFRALWTSSASSNLADGVAFISMPLLAVSLTDDPRLVAGLATTYALVRLLVALPIGVWVDRVDRRTLLIGANLIRGLAVLALAVSVQLDLATLPLLYAAFAVVGTLESAADNASVSLLPGVVPVTQLDRANGRISAAQLIADEFAGPPLGGLLFAALAAAPLYLMGGLWAAAGILALALPIRRLGGSSPDLTLRQPIFREAIEGARWLAGNRAVGGLALIGALASVGYMLPFSILVLFAGQRLALDALGYGVILAVSALGGLVGSFSTARVVGTMGYRRTIIASLVTGAAALFALSIATNGVVAAVFLAVYILHAVVWGICATSLRQRLVPDALRGRVNAASRVLSLLGLALGSALGGLLAVVGLALPIAVGGGVFVCCAVLAVIVLPRDPAPDHPMPVRPGDNRSRPVQWCSFRGLIVGLTTQRTTVRWSVRTVQSSSQKDTSHDGSRPVCLA
ncbi:Predicted arabinose efflux permease, MFS family [Cryobacterium flavum]|uniref:MFS transporter n=1 Tax=Cryobacterium flavum TaxID=1424659 RepID=A0A4V3I9X2_9MICO|nr:MFS transporter [Cryobacterium flavum]TFB80988.1 MFS transporter [Cryobacterium flavum]SDM82111.1 Predicted arabinose efflux permease, MFS family [Cryobacterium flavum]